MKHIACIVGSTLGSLGARAIALAMFMGLGACGQKGPLSLPATAVSPSAPAQAAAATEPRP